MRNRPMVRRVVVVVGVGAGLCILLFALCILLFLGGFVREMWTQATLTPAIETELGFVFGTPYLDDTSVLGIEPISIESVSSGGVFDRAGFSTGEIIVTERSIAELCRAWSQSRGKPVAISVVPGGSGLPLADRPKRLVTFTMPKASGR